MSAEGDARDAPSATSGGSAPAVFLDRDGTLIEERGLVERPEQVVLLPGVAGAIQGLRQAGYLIVVVTNQSAIARGLLDLEGLDGVHRALRERLLRLGAAIDDIYSSPDPPDPEAEQSQPFAMRKPGAGMLLRAADEHGLDIAASWMIGDQVRDAIAGRRAGCRGSLLVRTGSAPLPDEAHEHAAGIFDDLSAAARFILARGFLPNDPEAAAAQIDGAAAAAEPS
jgi:D-glycero-D-manno-heptose 1,7-bisphosphate phosphatase